MLLSPDARTRARAKEQLKQEPAEPYRNAVLFLLAEKAHDPAHWAAELEVRAKNAGGPEFVRVKRMLGHLHGSKQQHVGVDFYFVSVPKELAKRILGHDAATTVHPAKGGAWKQWWTWLRKDGRVKLRFGRGIAGQDTRPASARVVRNVSYIRDIVVDERGVADPVVGTLESGIVVRWTPKLSEDQAYVTFNLDIGSVDLARPIATVKVDRAGREFEIQKPDVVKTAQRKRITLPLGGHCAWSVPDRTAEKEGRTLLVLLRAVLGPPEAEEWPAR